MLYKLSTESTNWIPLIKHLVDLYAPLSAYVELADDVINVIFEIDD